MYSKYTKTMPGHEVQTGYTNDSIYTMPPERIRNIKYIETYVNHARLYFKSKYKCIRNVNSCNRREYVLKTYVNHAFLYVRIKIQMSQKCTFLQ